MELKGGGISEWSLIIVEYPFSIKNMKKFGKVLCITVALSSIGIGSTPLTVSANQEEVQEIQQDFSQYLEVVETEQGTEYHFTDEAYTEVSRQLGNDIPSYNHSNVLRSGDVKVNGVNKIVREDGLFKIYLSANTLNNIQSGGTATLFSLLGSAIGGSVGSAIGAGLSEIIDAPHYSHGRVYVYDGVFYQYYYLQ
ncbi:hypothetical protein [Dolosigranulum pigrum]|uniref:hypothetical protein n=1 Tax=Dolosigranulum pigrum TaxID=29394 RepID=UPI001AD8960D|nr:hypothetical protein [Dolosigranulum pigrum]QTJ35498.1 hypothetical protein FE323_00220 [Dolosigranulum pigrum]